MEGTLGERIRELRMAHEWTYRQLGAKVGVAGAYIHQLETGARQRPNVELVQRLAAVFGMGLDELLGDEPIDPDIAEIVVNLKATKKLDPQALKELAGIILAVKEKTEREAQS